MLRNRTERNLTDARLSEMADGTAALTLHPSEGSKKWKDTGKTKRKKEGQMKVTYSDLSVDLKEVSEPLTLLPPLSGLDKAINYHEEPTVPLKEDESQDPSVPESEPAQEHSGKGDLRAFSEASGIIYEIAEELYFRERTAAEIEALCQPPFRKVFDTQQLEQMNRRADETARRSVPLSDIFSQDSGEDLTPSREESSIGTGAAFSIQLLFLLPGINILAALWLSFRKKTNPNLRSYSRAFLIWLSLVGTAALTFFAVQYFTVPIHHTFWHKLTALFS